MSSDAKIIERWTRVVGVRSPNPVDGEVWVVPPGISPLATIAHLQTKLLESGAPIRIVAARASLVALPRWTDTLARELRLTELDAYGSRDGGRSIHIFYRAAASWLRQVLPNWGGQLTAEKVFWASATERFLKRLAEAWCWGHELYRIHGEAVRSLYPEWFGFQVYRAATGNRADRVPMTRRVIYGVAFVLVGLAGYFFVSLRRLVQFWDERLGRRRLRELRQKYQGNQPRWWIALVANWPHVSRVVLDAMVPVAQSRKEKIGVLLIGSLRSGLASGAFSRQIDKRKIFPALESIADDVVAVDQAMSAESVAQLLLALGSGLLATVASIGRILTRRFCLSVGDRWLTVPLPINALARLVTVDVAVVIEAHQAATRLVERRSFSNTTIVYPHANAPVDATGEEALRRSGCITVELMHGLSEICHQLGPGRTQNSYKLMWTEPEAHRLHEYYPTQVIRGGYLPRRVPDAIPPVTLTPETTLKVLLTTNYVVKAWGLNPELFEPYLEPFLRAVRAAFAQQNVEFRWRTHPGDDPRRIADLQRHFPEFLPSPSVNAESDLHWCDVLVTSFSSLAIEALFYRVPIFVHAIPRWDASAFALFSPHRCFESDDDLKEKVRSVMELLRNNAVDQALAIEMQTRGQLFGPDGMPKSIEAFLSSV